MSVSPERRQEAKASFSRLERTQLRAAALQTRAKHLAEQAEAKRAHHESLDVVYKAVDRDGEVAGGIIAGALAYRLFIWLLPFVLVLVAGLGLTSAAASKSPTEAARSLGLAGLVSNSIASSAEDSARWYALLVGIPITVFATRSVLRVLIGAHRLVWTDLRAAAPRPTARQTLRLLGLILCFFGFTALAGAARAASVGLGVLVSLVLLVPYAGFWLLVSIRLPHRNADWVSLIPGALLFGVGIEVLQLVAAYVVAPMSLSKQGTYGALGIAAGLLVGLFLVSRLMVGSAVLNATLWEGKARAEQEGSRSSGSHAT
jgi:uncharacterized BrkB/YihY/UPF0761 family membrane protein